MQRVFPAAAMFSFAVLLSFGGAVHAKEVSSERIKIIAKAADAVREVKPTLAADCRFAYSLMAGFIENIDDELMRHNDFGGLSHEGALDLADVWGLVLYREAKREDKDPMEIKGRFIKEVTGSTRKVNSERRRRGSYSMTERQISKCEKAAEVGEGENDHH